MTETSPEKSYQSVIHTLSRLMVKGVIPAGDVAALRRGRDGPAFWKIAVSHLEPASLLVSPEDDQRWSVILAGLAKNPGLHQKNRRFGRALAEAEISEARVLRLVRSHGHELHDALRGVVGQLSNAGQHFDWTRAAELVLSDGKPWEEKVRRGIALEYYRALGQQSQAAKEEN